LNKAANIYWDSTQGSVSVSRRSQPARRRRVSAKANERTTPWWLTWVIFGSIFGMLIISINFRAFSEMREEVDQHGRLSGQIQNLMDENLALQEEIHTLKSDPRVIEREAKRIGIGVKPVVTNQ
jgi:cell division protein FtsB